LYIISISDMLCVIIAFMFLPFLNPFSQRGNKARLSYRLYPLSILGCF
jgi:hypothetical protein